MLLLVSAHPLQVMKAAFGFDVDDDDDDDAVKLFVPCVLRLLTRSVRENKSHSKLVADPACNRHFIGVQYRPC